MTKPNQTLAVLLFDGSSIIRRIYEGTPHENPSEKVAAALETSVNRFKYMLRFHAPTHALAVFDHGGKNWRHDLYPAYQEKRPPTPEHYVAMVLQVMERLESLKLQTVRVPGVEADDVLADIVLKLHVAAKGSTVTVLSTDKDLAHFGTMGVTVINPFTNKHHDDAWVREKFGVSNTQLQDFLALSGDTADGIPGIKGIGPKSAAKLLVQYGSLEGILAASSEIEGKIGELIRGGIEQARLSRQLVAFRSISIGRSLSQLRYVA